MFLGANGSDAVQRGVWISGRIDPSALLQQVVESTSE